MDQFAIFIDDDTKRKFRYHIGRFEILMERYSLEREEIVKKISNTLGIDDRTISIRVKSLTRPGTGEKEIFESEVNSVRAEDAK